MQQRTALTRFELLVIIGILMFLGILFFVVVPFMNRAPILLRRFSCQGLLKGIGSSMSLYASDYDGRFPQLSGTGPWSKNLGFAYDLAKPDFNEGGKQSNIERTITASWYLLVREIDMSPTSFRCPGDKDATWFDGKNPQELDIVELWDFGSEPHMHVSYGMHNPYGAYPASNGRPSSFAVAADMSPWFRRGDIVPPNNDIKDWVNHITLLPPYFSDKSITKMKILSSNGVLHYREGQSVLFADGHTEFVKTPDVGVKHDNIYTYWSTPTKPTESDIRIGTNPTSRSKENDAQSPDDSFLAI